MQLESPMLMTLRTELRPSGDAVRYYVECLCKACSQRFRFHVPVPYGQSRPRSCPHCGTPLGVEDTLRLKVFVDLVTARICDDEQPLFLTGTCANCKSRLRFNAREICDLDTIRCPHCGFDLGEDGRQKLILHAQKLLGETKD